MSTLCPKCLKDDQLQKVSAIVAGGTFKTTYQMPAQGEIAGHKIYGSLQQTGTGTTELAQRLNIDFSRIAKDINNDIKKNSVKNREKFNKAYKETYPPPKDSTISLFLAYSAIIIFVGGVIATFLLRNVQNQNLPSSICGSSVIAFFVLYFIAGKVNNQEVKEWIKGRNQAAKKAEESCIVSIERAKRKYSNMYYCHRDDVVFVAGETTWANSSEIMDFVFR